MGSFPFAFSYFPATPALLHHLLYLGTFMWACFVSLPCKAFVGLLCTLKNSGCILFLVFSDFGPRQLPFLPRVAGGLGSAFERHTRNLAAVPVMFWWWRAVGCYIEVWSEVTQNFWIPTSRVPPLMFHLFNATVAWCAPQRVTISTLATPSPFITGLLRIIHG